MNSEVKLCICTQESGLVNMILNFNSYTRITARTSELTYICAYISDCVLTLEMCEVNLFFTRNLGFVTDYWFVF